MTFPAHKSSQTLASLEDLPDELLLKVVRCVDLQNRKACSNYNDRHIPYFGRFSTLYVLSQVNRRLRAIARPFLRVDLYFNDYARLVKALDELQK